MRKLILLLLIMMIFTITCLAVDERDLYLDGKGHKDNTYLVILNAEPDDIGVELSGAGSYSEDSQVEISASLGKDYEFVSWAGSIWDISLLDDPFSDTASFIMPGRNVTFTAVYEENFESIPAVISIGLQEAKGIYRYSFTGDKHNRSEGKMPSWTGILAGVEAIKLRAGDITDNGYLEVIAELDGFGLWYYSFYNLIWTKLSDASIDFDIADVDGISKIIASFDEGLFKYDHAKKGWTLLNSTPAEIIVAADIYGNSQDELILSFLGINKLHIYSFDTGIFTHIVPVAPSQITSGDINNDGKQEIICAFDGIGTYIISFVSKGDSDRTSNSGEKSSYNSNPKDLNISRVLFGTPDDDHFMRTGNITSNLGEELILAHGGKTYYYSDDDNKWTNLYPYPLQNVISGRFSGEFLDDLIACDSIVGNIYIYISALESWQLILQNGDSNAMTPLK